MKEDGPQKVDELLEEDSELQLDVLELLTDRVNALDRVVDEMLIQMRNLNIENNNQHQIIPQAENKRKNNNHKAQKNPKKKKHFK